MKRRSRSHSSALPPLACLGLAAFLLGGLPSAVKADDSKLPTRALPAETLEIEGSLDGGAGYSEGGPYEMTAVVGAPESGFASGGNYSLRGGLLPFVRLPLRFEDGFESGAPNRWDSVTGASMTSEEVGSEDLDRSAGDQGS